MSKPRPIIDPATGEVSIHVHRAAAVDALDGYGGESENKLRDLLADLMHYCDGDGIAWDFDTELEAARGHYEAEREGFPRTTGPKPYDLAGRYTWKQVEGGWFAIVDGRLWWRFGHTDEAGPCTVAGDTPEAAAKFCKAINEAFGTAFKPSDFPGR